MNIKYYIVKTVDGAITQITEKKSTKRDRHGRFTAGYTIRFRQQKAKTCAFAEICPIAM